MPNYSAVMCQSVIMFKRLNTLRVRDFITDGSQKVIDAHGAHCRGINPVGYPLCVYGGSPWERRHQRLYLNSASYKERPPTSGCDSMKADSTKLRDATTSLIHLQLLGVHSLQN